MGLWVADGENMEVVMANRPNCKRLVLETAAVAVLILELINQVLDLVNKAVNYDRSVRNLPILVSPQG